MARPRWSVDIIRKRGEHLGTVEAKDEKEAIAKATEDRSDQQPISIFCQGFMPTMLPGAPQRLVQTDPLPFSLPMSLIRAATHWSANNAKR